MNEISEKWEALVGRKINPPYWVHDMLADIKQLEKELHECNTAPNL